MKFTKKIKKYFTKARVDNIEKIAVYVLAFNYMLMGIVNLFVGDYHESLLMFTILLWISMYQSMKNRSDRYRSIAVEVLDESIELLSNLANVVEAANKEAESVSKPKKVKKYDKSK